MSESPKILNDRCLVCNKHFLPGEDVAFRIVEPDLGFCIPVYMKIVHLACTQKASSPQIKVKPKIKKFVPDETKSWEERYKALEAHHIEETTALQDRIDTLRKERDDAEADYCDLEEEFSKFRQDHEDK
jgi:hypothetical protein